MEISKREFDIPMVLEPEYLASPYLDELSGMTYLSYFMKEGSPGFHATLRWVNSQLSHTSIRNFTVSGVNVFRFNTISHGDIRLFCRRTGTTAEFCAESSETWAARCRPTKNSILTCPRGNITCKWVRNNNINVISSTDQNVTH